MSMSKVRKRAKIRNRYNQVSHLTQDTNGNVTSSQLAITNKGQEVSAFPAGDHMASINRHEFIHFLFSRLSIALTTREAVLHKYILNKKVKEIVFDGPWQKI